MSGKIRRAGLIVPSSNTVVEDVWARMGATMPGLRCHFARISVTRIHQDASTAAQFEQERLLAAAALLAELSPDRIVWAGTAAAWLGFERDRALCAAIEAQTGVPTTTSLLAVNDALVTRGVSRIALVTPYEADTEAAIVANYEAAGLSVVARRRMDLTENTQFAAVPERRLLGMVEDVSGSEAEAIVILCTNLLGAPVVESASAGTREKVIDSVLATFLSLRDNGSLESRKDGHPSKAKDVGAGSA